MGEGSEREQCSAVSGLSVTSSATHKQIGPFWCWSPGGWVCVHSRTLWVSLMNSPMRLGVSPAAQPTQIFWSEVLRLYFLMLEPQVACSVWLLSCSFSFIHTQMWDCPVLKPQPCLVLWLPPCLESSPPLLPVSVPPTSLDEVSSSTLWLSDFHTVWFFGSSGYFLFWLCEEAKCIYLCLHLGWKSSKIFLWLSTVLLWYA